MVEPEKESCLACATTKLTRFDCHVSVALVSSGMMSTEAILADTFRPMKSRHLSQTTTTPATMAEQAVVDRRFDS